MKILKKTHWFANRKKFDIDCFELLEPQRLVNENSRGKTGTFYSVKCKRHIQYESRLELNFFESLEISPEVLFYWEQPVKIQYRLSTGKKISYFPDAGIYLKSKEFILVEIKELPAMLENYVQKKIEGLMHFCSKKGFGLLLTDGKHTIDVIKKYQTNKKLEKAILNAIQDYRVITRSEYKSIMKDSDGTQKELLKIVHKNDLKFGPRGCRLMRNNKNQIFRHVFIEHKPYEEIYSFLFHSNELGLR